MADDDVMVAQVEADPIEPNNRIADLLAAIEKENHLDAETFFNDLIGDRLSTALDQRKVSLAQSVFNNEPETAETEEEELDTDISDDEFEAELDALETSAETDEEEYLETEEELEN
jgi:hypothetical protein